MNDPEPVGTIVKRLTERTATGTASMVHEKARLSFAANTRPYLNPIFPNLASGVFPIHVGASNEIPPHIPNSFRLFSPAADGCCPAGTLACCAALSGTTRRSAKNNESVRELGTRTQ